MLDAFQLVSSKEPMIGNNFSTGLVILSQFLLHELIKYMSEWTSLALFTV